MRNASCCLLVVTAFVAHAAKARAQCVSDADCRLGRVCVNGTCTTPAPACTMDSQCPQGLVCVNGSCGAPPTPSPGYQQPPPGGYPPQAGYAPPQHGGLPPAGGYPPPQQAGLPPVGGFPPPQGGLQPTGERERGKGSPRGPGAFLLLGLLACIDGSDIECNAYSLSASDPDPSFAMAAGFFYRFIDYLGVDLQMVFGMLDAERVDLVYLAGFLVGPRAYVPIADVVDLEVGLGFGYGHAEAQVELGKSWVHGFLMGLKFGAEYRVVPAFSIGTMFHFLFNFYDEACAEPDHGDKECDDIDDPEDNPYGMIWGIQGSFYFMP